jgi:hypothetical protein
MGITGEDLFAAGPKAARPNLTARQLAQLYRNATSALAPQVDLVILVLSCGYIVTGHLMQAIHALVPCTLTKMEHILPVFIFGARVN